MKSSEQEILPIIGTTMAGGFYAGRINIEGQLFALIVAPKAEGEQEGVALFSSSKDVPSAKSWNDGLANTNALAEAGCKPAQWARDLRIDGHDDWYLPSLDELEVIYRNLKPTAEENYVYNRSGLNLSAVPPTRPYTLELPTQTLAEAFQEGGEQAFADRWHWSSTLHASDSDFAWCQHFYDGLQSYSTVVNVKLRARAVRRLPI